MEKVQNKYMKMSTGLDRNISTYIWQMEAGRPDIEIESKIRISILEQISTEGARDERGQVA